MHIFISYAKTDTRDLAIQVCDSLTALPGVTAWMDTSLYSGEDWAVQIQDEIDRADLVVVLLSQDVNRPTNHPKGRSFVLKEIHYAQQVRKSIIPIMAQATRVPVQLAGIEYIDFTRDPSAGLQRLVREIARRAGISLPASPSATPPPQPPLDSPSLYTETGQRGEVAPAGRGQGGGVSCSLILSALSLIALVAAAVFLVLPFLNPQPTPTAALQPTSTNTLSTLVADTPPPAVPTSGVTPTFSTSDPSAFTPITGNADWTPRFQTFDGFEMVLVPVGCFMMGSNVGDFDEKPVHQQCFDQPFWIDRNEVTNSRYGSSGRFEGNNRPRDTITWSVARDFCAEREARLPTEREWEYAARGPDGLKYPWGNDFVSEDVVYSENSSNETAEVGSRPSGASWVGALDMSGNVWEWVSTIHDQDRFPYPYRPDDGREENEDSIGVSRVLRGGSFYETSSHVRTADRYGDTTGDNNLGFGFRCARSYSEASVPATPDTPTAAVPTLDVTPTFITATAVLSGFTPITSNTDWTPQFQIFDSFEMALVPVGCFMMGSESGEDDEKPAHKQCFDQPFWIDRTEVTNAQFGSSGAFSGDNRPRDSVTWFEARDFCARRDARLPTEREWEYAARGPDNLIYPWGNEFAADNVVYNTSGSSFVGSKPDGVSWVGAQDMSGNLWEWVSTIYDQDRFKYPYNPDDGREEISDSIDILRVTRGGSWESSDEFLPASNRSLSGPTTRTNYYGFRCARDY